MKKLLTLLMTLLLLLSTVFMVYGKDYTIKPGDMLWKIASDNDTTVDAIVADNDINDKDLIYVGDVITLPEESNNTEVKEMALVKSWETDGFIQAESVLYVPNHEWIYVSNVNDQALGYISRVGLDGVVDNYKFTDNLPIPLGMAYYNNEIYVASTTSIKVIDINTGAVVEELIAADGGMLNDITITPEGELYVTDSVSKKIYTRNESALEVFYESEDFIMLNGILYDNGNLLVSNMDMTTGTGTIHKINVATKELVDVESTSGLGAVDGITKLNDQFLVSDATAKELVLFNDNSTTVLGKVEGGMADISVNSSTGEIYLPFLDANAVASYSYVEVDKSTDEEIKTPATKPDKEYNTMSFILDLSAEGDLISITQADGGAQLPLGVRAMEGNVEAGLALTSLVTDKDGEVIGYASELEDFTNTRATNAPWAASWIVTIPGRGSLFGYEDESIPTNQGEIFATLAEGKTWTGDITSKMAVGPRDDGYGIIIGGTGEFAGASGRFAESVNVTLMSPTNEIESVLELRFDLD